MKHLQGRRGLEDEGREGIESMWLIPISKAARSIQSLSRGLEGPLVPWSTSLRPYHSALLKAPVPVPYLLVYRLFGVDFNNEP